MPVVTSCTQITQRASATHCEVRIPAGGAASRPASDQWACTWAARAGPEGHPSACVGSGQPAFQSLLLLQGRWLYANVRKVIQKWP